MNINDLPKTVDKEIEFEGFPSGDMESFCFDVTKEDYIKINGEEPGEFDKSVNKDNLYRIYPDDFFGFDKPKCKIKISI